MSNPRARLADHLFPNRRIGLWVVSPLRYRMSGVAYLRVPTTFRATPWPSMALASLAEGLRPKGDR